MNRKHFLASASTLLAASALPSVPAIASDVNEKGAIPLVPRYLKAGDIIGIATPAGYITPDEIQPAVKLMGNWGYKIKISDTIGKKDFTFAGTDEERLNDFQNLNGRVYGKLV